MLDTETLNIASKRIVLKIAEQRKQLIVDLSRCKSEHARNGTFLGSGTCLKDIQTLCANAVRNRAKFAWQNLQKVVTTGDIKYSEDSATELKDFIAGFLPADIGDIGELFRENFQRLGLSRVDLLKELETELANARIHALEKVGNDIDLFVRQSLLNEQKPKEQNTQVIHIEHSRVGAISGRDTNVSISLLQLLQEAEKVVSNRKLPEKDKKCLLDKIKGILTHPAFSSIASVIIEGMKAGLG